uniref:Transmembrane protein 100 n=1 Tax=Gouania willdenowi TaxID=441366 RepID=A0A8C5HF90_GOUWI
ERLPSPPPSHSPPTPEITRQPEPITSSPLGCVGTGQAKPPESLPTLERLAQATGGTEKSWYRCVLPFGFISLVIGMAGTGVTFTFNTPLQTKVVSGALLCVGMLMLLVAVVCWRAHRIKRRKKKEGGFFTADQGTLNPHGFYA